MHPAAIPAPVPADLARLIRRMGDEGPRNFYEDEIAATIARQIQAGGGVLTEDDFHDFQAKLVEPLHVRYRGYDLYTPPLPSGGLTSLAILKTLEQFDVRNSLGGAANAVVLDAATGRVQAAASGDSSGVIAF